jgi:NIMA (never in mitosis gene a)-related kinase
MIKDYEIKKKLGVGTYGIVYLVSKKTKNEINDNNNNLYVIKQIPLFGLTPSEKKEVKLEASILSQIKSTYVVKFFDSFEENNNLNIVMEYCEGGDLEKIISNKKKFPLEEDFIWKIFIQIALGLAAIHNLKILHRDLKTSNIFLTKN